MMQDIFDAEIWKTLRSMVPILMVIMIVLTAAIGYFVKANSDELGSQEAQILATQAQSAQQGALFQTFLKAFDLENNYECRVLYYLNLHDSNVPIPPSLSVCEVKAP